MGALWSIPELALSHSKGVEYHTTFPLHKALGNTPSPPPPSPVRILTQILCNNVNVFKLELFASGVIEIDSEFNVQAYLVFTCFSECKVCIRDMGAAIAKASQGV